MKLVFYQFGIFMLCLLFQNTVSTLSKSDRKRSAVHPKPKPKIIVEANEALEKKLLFYNDFLTKKEILETYDKLDTSKKQLDGVTLAYVTPWNNHGYDVVKWAAKKFTHISPVWFQLNLVDEPNDDMSCSITGGHDIDHGWMSDIRLNNSDIVFVPRLLLDKYSQKTLDKLLVSEKFQSHCAFTIINFIEIYGFDGVVLEIWLQLMAITQGSASEYIIELIEYWGKRFAQKHMVFILTMPPSLNHELINNNVVSPQNLYRLSKAVDYLNLMTYDFPVKHSSPIAPTYWLIPNVNYVIENGFPPKKVLLGLNFYGYQYPGNNKESKIFLGKDFIKYLKRDETNLEYDKTAEEHRILITDKHVVYYPTKKSLKTRINFAKTSHLGGVAIWEIGQGLNHFTSLF